MRTLIKHGTVKAVNLVKCLSTFCYVLALSEQRNVLLFLGSTIPFRAVSIFCAYTGVAVMFVYFYMITFTVACLTYSGRREKANKHPFTCRELPPKSQFCKFSSVK